MKRLIFTIAVLFFMLPTIVGAQTFMEALNKRDTVTVIKMLKDGYDINKADKNNGMTPLIIACREDNYGMAKFLLDHGAKVDYPRSPKGRTPLMVACAYFGCVGICKLLLDHGANVNAVADDGTTPLIIAAAGGKIDMVKLFLSKGADTKAKDISGLTALRWAENITQATLDQLKGIHCKLDKDAVIAELKGK